MDRNERAYWAEVIGLAVLAVVFFRFGLLLVVFLLPIQVAWARRGERAGLLTSGIFVVLLALLKGVDYLRIRSAMPEGGAGILFLDIVLPVGFLVGLYALNVPVFKMISGGRPLGTMARIGAALGAAVAIYVPATVLVYLSGAVDTLIAAQTELVSSLLSASNATDAEVQQYTRLIIQIFLSGFLLGYFLVLAGSWWVGSRLVLRGRLAVQEDNAVIERLRGLDLTRFRAPARLVWGLIVALGTLVVTLKVDVGWFAFVVRNALLVVLALYAMQGVAIIWFLLEKRGASRGARMGIAVGLIFATLIPGLNVAILLGLPGLGISEVWVNYHRFERSGEGQ